ncbi:MAG TPA: Xaa-Pro peptidase family protein [Pirellulales bacterium]|jgi:Xaa-Pro aminopeptidase|nr:Xaa-Pro peptidase family protein [Pirellulales bacterium]
MSRFAARRSKLKRLFRKEGVQALLVTNFTNVTYLTGFTGDDSYLLLIADRAILISDPRYTTQIEQECPDIDAEIRPPGVGMVETIGKLTARAKVKKLGIEAGSMTVALGEQIRGASRALELVSTNNLVESLRVIKDKEEVEEIRRAIWIAERAFGLLRAALRDGRTEKEVADDLENQTRLFGGKSCSFPPIVAVGPRSALPHARPTDQKIGDYDFVLVDWGADGGQYKSDLTRVLVTGKIPPKLERIYGVVLSAQEQAIASIRPGVSCQDVDQVARSIIGKAGFARNFGHGLGHGIGLDIHEAPRLAAKVETLLEPGMVVTVEPGIYLPGWGGVRIEDDVLVTKEGCEVLTSTAKRWEDAIVH